LDVTDLGWRGVYNALNRFTSPDRFAEKFPWQSPYIHAAGNPIRYVDVRGDSIWYTQEDNVITMHVTGKVYNNSSDNINMDRAADDIAAGIEEAFTGYFKMNGEIYTLVTDVQLEAVKSMDDVASSDHLFVIQDDDGKSARGVINMNGGKVMNIAASDFANDNLFSNMFSRNNTRSAVHEFGHAAGLNHVSGVLNLMKQMGLFSYVSPAQRAEVYYNRNKINRGSNSNSPWSAPYPFVHDPQTGQTYRASDLFIWNTKYRRK